eukprot:365237-Chlamydomonas_euryale.AAC.5
MRVLSHFQHEQVSVPCALQNAQQLATHKHAQEASCLPRFVSVVSRSQTAIAMRVQGGMLQALQPWSVAEVSGMLYTSGRCGGGRGRGQWKYGQGPHNVDLPCKRNCVEVRTRSPQSRPARHVDLPKEITTAI